jgi:hypothetical protein
MRRAREPHHLGFHERHERGCVGDRVAAGFGRRAVTRLAVEAHLEVHLPVAEADDLQIRRLGDDGEIGPTAMRDGVLGTGASRFLVDDDVERDAPAEGYPGTLHGQDRLGHGGDARLHIARAEPVEQAIAHHRDVGVARPALARRHRVAMAVQQQRRTVRRTQLGSDVRPSRVDILEPRVDPAALEGLREHARGVALVPRRIRARGLHEAAEQVERLLVVDRGEDASIEVGQHSPFVAVGRLHHMI